MRLEPNDKFILEDIKAKHHQQILNRFLNTNRKLLDEPLTDLIASLFHCFTTVPDKPVTKWKSKIGGTVRIHKH
jgi:hypothetical protein